MTANPTALRDALLEALPKGDGAEDLEGDARIFFPSSHRKALARECSLIIGERGAGKSFCAEIIGNPGFRSKIAAAQSLEWLSKTSAFLAHSANPKMRIQR